jgi:phosphopentomutase
MKVHGVGKIGDIFAGCDIDESHPDEVERRGHHADRAAAARARRRLVFVNLVETDMLWGTATTRSTSTAACRTSTAGCPTCSTRCARATCFILTSDHGCDPTTPSTDHSREHALLLAYVEGRTRTARSTRASSRTSARL